jgi:hypothetical protein
MKEPGQLDRLNGIVPADLKPTPRVIWAHAGGQSRFNPDGNDLTLWLDRLLGDKDIQGNKLKENEQLEKELMLDLSWDYVAGNIKANIYDQLRRAPRSSVAQRLAPVADELQNIDKLYNTFNKNGSWADKAGDIGDPNLAAVHRVAAEADAEMFHLALENFKETVKPAVADDDVLNYLVERMVTHGDQGNNWLYIFNQYQDRLLWGSDALAVGSKVHGDMQYELNVRDLYPVYELLEQISGRIEERWSRLSDETKTALGDNPQALDEISNKIRYKNYEKFWDDDTPSSNGVVRMRPGSRRSIRHPYSRAKSATGSGGSHRVFRKPMAHDPFGRRLHIRLVGRTHEFPDRA